LTQPAPPQTVVAESAPAVVAAPADWRQQRKSLLSRAKQNDRQALETMFRQFLPPGERIETVEYFGAYGFWFWSVHSFAAVTPVRVGEIRAGGFRALTYQDAPLEYLNSTVVHQPSLAGLYMATAALVVCTLGIGILFIPLLHRWYFLHKKCGLVLCIRDGISVYVFIDRKRTLMANRLYRDVARVREARVRSLAAR